MFSSTWKKREWWTSKFVLLKPNLVCELEMKLPIAAILTTLKLPTSPTMASTSTPPSGWKQIFNQQLVTCSVQTVKNKTGAWMGLMERGAETAGFRSYRSFLHTRKNLSRHSADSFRLWKSINHDMERCFSYVDGWPFVSTPFPNWLPLCKLKPLATC